MGRSEATRGSRSLKLSPYDPERGARMDAPRPKVGELVGEHLLGASLYVNGHRLELQADVAALPREDAPTDRRVRLQTSVVC